MLKSFNGDLKPERLAQVREAAAGHPDVHVVDRYVTAAERDALVAGCDCFVSLHRAEGFGLGAGRGDGAGAPGDRHRLLRQRRLHDAGELVAGATAR